MGGAVVVGVAAVVLASTGGDLRIGDVGGAVVVGVAASGSS